MKNILMRIIILIFISSQVAGQQFQDTLYLKNGDKACGKILWKTNKEYGFQNSEGSLITFSIYDIEKIASEKGLLVNTSQELILKKANPDTLTIDELTLYSNKAVKMRNAGIIVTSVGVVAAVTGSFFAMRIGKSEHDDLGEAIKAALCGVVAIPLLSVGVPLWAVGGSRKAKAEFALEKLNIAPENSMALGLGITIRF